MSTDSLERLIRQLIMTVSAGIAASSFGCYFGFSLSLTLGIAGLLGYIDMLIQRSIHHFITGKD